MGLNVSKNIVKNVNNTYIINKSDIEIINKQLFETSVESTVKVCNSHASIISNINEFLMSGVKIKGDLDIDILQSNYAKIKFTSEIITEIINNIESEMTTQLINNIQQSVDQNILTNMLTKAEENLKEGWGSIPKIGDNNETSTSTTNNTNIQNITDIKLSNIVEICMNISMNTENMNECINSTINKNAFTVLNADIDGSANIKLTQSNELINVTECITSVKIISSITNNLASLTGVEIVDDKKTTSKTDSTIEAKKVVETQGVGGAVKEAAEGIGNGIGSIFSGVGDIFGSVQYIISAVALSICCILIIAVVAIGYILTSETGGKNVMTLANMATDIIPQTRIAKSVANIK